MIFNYQVPFKYKMRHLDQQKAHFKELKCGCGDLPGVLKWPSKGF